MADNTIRYTHADLVKLAKRWLATSWRNASTQGHGACPVIMAETVTLLESGEIPDAIGWHCGYSILIECKTSRADFRADRKKLFRRHAYLGLGSQRYFLAPAGLISAAELPAQWGLLEVNARGKVEVTRASEYFGERNMRGEVTMLLSCIRRMKREKA
ncbi:MAG TPA: hypothetical protein VGL77_19800 [Armatimonadota bacterium]|jgi:hypothetical protein